MKVILNEEVIGLGEPGKVVDVAPGYARNFLVPRKLAEYANAGKVKELEHNRKRLERKRQRLQVAAMSTVEKIAATPLTIEAKGGRDGKLYGSVTTVDIANALQQQVGVTVDRRKIHLTEPIRTVGEHTANVHLIGDTHATVTVRVVDLTQHEAPAEAPQAAAPAAPVEAPVEESEVAAE